MRGRFSVIALVLLISCSSAKKEEDRFLSEVTALSKQEILARGDQLAAAKKWEQARKYYAFLADTFPNDPAGRLAALKIADTFFQSSDPESRAEAEVRYKDFATRFPNDPHRAYALLQLGKCSLRRAKGPQRDTTPLREASEAFQQVLTLFPNSQEAKEAADLLSRCREDLARHELEVARYYFSVGATEGARLRLAYLLKNYSDTQAAEEGRELLTTLDSGREVSGRTEKP